MCVVVCIEYRVLRAHSHDAPMSMVCLGQLFRPRASHLIASTSMKS
jgi:hypothetical protein